MIMEVSNEEHNVDPKCSIPKGKIMLEEAQLRVHISYECIEIQLFFVTYL